MSKPGIYWRIGAVLMLALVATILWPFLVHLPAFRTEVLGDSRTLFTTALLRSLGMASIGSLTTVSVAFFLAVALVRIPSSSLLGKSLGILILPITLGNISIAFLCKILLADTMLFAAIASGGNAGKLALLFGLGFWQYGILFIYLFWLNFQAFPQGVMEYSKALGFSKFQVVKDIYFPRSRNLLVLLTSSLFLFTVYEESKVQYLLKPSPGTGFELAATWLSRSYQSLLVANHEHAQQLVFNVGTIDALLVLCVATLLFILWNALQTASARIPRYPKTAVSIQTRGGLSSSLIALVLLGLTVIPVLASLTQLRWGPHFDLFSLLPSLGMTLVATFSASALAIALGVAARLGWKHRLSSFGPKSMVFFLGLLALLLVPPLVVLLSGFTWMREVGYDRGWMVYVVWTAGHTLLLLPVLGSFALFNHFRVSTQEIDYLIVSSFGNWQIIKTSFLQRFRAEYMLLIILAFSFIWNEGVINSLFSDFIPSFAANMKMLITGRAADLHRAMGYFVASLALSMVSVSVWQYILAQALSERAHS